MKPQRYSQERKHLSTGTTPHPFYCPSLQIPSIPTVYEQFSLLQAFDDHVKHGQQVFKLTDPELNKIIDSYITMKKLKECDFLLLETDKQRPISQPTLSKKIEEVFLKYIKHL
jgi:hypothetical protein